ncbi:MAG: hypothetical protein RH946_05385 [Rhodospirillales bacterium]
MTSKPEVTAARPGATLSPLEAHYVSQAIRHYCRDNAEAIWRLPVAMAATGGAEPLPPKLVRVSLPDWAGDAGIDGSLAVPVHLSRDGDGPLWERTAWFSVIAWYLHGTAERAFEDIHGPVHSFAFKLTGWPAEMWECAWANRIVIFLRRWAAHVQNADEDALFGSRPQAHIVLSHDVDYIAKGFDFRLKQFIHLGREVLARLRPSDGAEDKSSIMGSLRKTCLPGDYFTLPALLDMETDLGIKSVIHFYARTAQNGRSLMAAFADPRYDVARPDVVDVISRFRDGGWRIGLHQSFSAWQSAERMAEERNKLKEIAGTDIDYCRQHWLRFSWRDTWPAQQAAGFKHDGTLGFNELPGFRTGSALAVSPWGPGDGKPLTIITRPLIAMDAHANHFARGADGGAGHAMRRYVEEVRAVGGEATIAWHPHTLHTDFAADISYPDFIRSMDLMGAQP